MSNESKAENQEEVNNSNHADSSSSAELHMDKNVLSKNDIVQSNGDDTQQTLDPHIIRAMLGFLDIHGYEDSPDTYNLPVGFKWVNVDVNNARHLRELRECFNEELSTIATMECYKTYSARLLKWSLQPPGWRPDWHIGLRAIYTGKLIAFVAAIPRTMKIYAEIKDIGEVTLLFYDKDVITGPITSLLLREITRRIESTGTFEILHYQAISDKSPSTILLSYNRYLDPNKVTSYEIAFGNIPDLPDTFVNQLTIRNETNVPGFRKMIPTDIFQAHELLTNYLNKFDISPIFTLDSFAYWFKCRPQLVESFVVEKDNDITDFISYYTAQFVDEEQDIVIKVAHLFYSVATATPLSDLIKCALVTAKVRNFDMFNAFDVMDNRRFLERSLFLDDSRIVSCYFHKWNGTPFLPGRFAFIPFQV